MSNRDEENAENNADGELVGDDRDEEMDQALLVKLATQAALDNPVTPKLLSPFRQRPNHGLGDNEQCILPSRASFPLCSLT